ncbi:MAG: hypothetical protein WDN46_14260 [Methylocella sp.]
MGAGYAPPGMSGQLPTSQYGQSAVTGNGMALQQAQQGQPGMLGQAPPSQVMQQPMQSYPSAPQY